MIKMKNLKKAYKYLLFAWKHLDEGIAGRYAAFLFELEFTPIKYDKLKLCVN